MTERWLDSQSDDQASARSESFWSAMCEDLDAGSFWADRIKQYRDEPGKRLQMAMEHLPLPAAFREAAVATRAIIRAKRKARENYEAELGMLYWLAAIASFMLPYAERLKEPGFNVIESIPGKRLRSLPINYGNLGYEQLGLLNKTDKKWIVEAWGEPGKHSTLNQVHRWLWDEYEEKLIQRRTAEREKSVQELRRLASESSKQRKAKGRKSKAGCLVVAALVCLTVLAAGIGMATLMGRLP